MRANFWEMALASTVLDWETRLVADVAASLSVLVGVHANTISIDLHYIAFQSHP